VVQILQVAIAQILLVDIAEEDSLLSLAITVVVLMEHIQEIPMDIQQVEAT
jgi:hypothetical protein